MQTTCDMRSQLIITPRTVMNTGAGNHLTRKEAEHPDTNNEDTKLTYKPQLLSLLSLPEPRYTPKLDSKTITNIVVIQF